MANYSTLKAAIADVVKTNGSQAITGDNLQQVLLSVVNSIGSGYLFMGVATPSTDPGTPDQNVFYIGGVGTYGNFGSTPLDVKMGQIGVFKGSGSTWSNRVLSVYSFADELVGNGGILNDTMKSILSSAVDVPYIIEGALINSSSGVYTYTKNSSWDLMCFTIKRDSDWAVISGIGTGSNQLGYLIDPEIGMSTDGVLVTPANTNKYTMSAFCQKVINVRNGGYDREILVAVNIPHSNNVDYGSLYVFQGRFDCKYFCVPNLLLVGNSGSPLLSRNNSYTITPYIKINGSPIAAINFWSNTNTSVTSGNGIHFYDSDYSFLGTLVLSDYSSMSSSNRRAIVIEKEDIPQNASYIRLTASSSDVSANLPTIVGGVEEFNGMGIMNFTSEHFFDKSSDERMSVLPFTMRVDNLLISDLYLLTGNEVILSDVYINEPTSPVYGDSVAKIAFYDADRNYLSAFDYLAFFNSKSSGKYTVTIRPTDIPAGAKYVIFFTYKSNMGAIKIIRGLADLNDPAYNYPLIVECQYEIKKGYVKDKMTPYETLTGFFMRVDGLRSLASYSVNKYYVEEGGEYYYSAYFQNSDASFNPLFFMDDNDDIVGYVGIKTGPLEIIDERVVIPYGATQVWQNVKNDYSERFSFSKITDVLKVDALKGDVEVLQEVVSELGGTTNKLMKVVINTLEGSAGASSFYVRSKYNQDKDIIITHYINGNGLVSSNMTYIGANGLSDNALMTGENLVSTHADSTAPIRAYTQYWHLFAQHGYPVPYFSNSVGMTSADIGAKWKDQLNREYHIGKVSDAYVWLLPVIYQDGNGYYTRDWHSTATSPTIETLTYVSGGSTGAYTTQIVVSAVYQEQLRSIMKHSGRTWTVDGRQVTEAGTYYCNSFSVSETQYGYDPATVSSWFGGTGGTPDLTGAEVMAEFTVSYNYTGANCAVNTTINLHREA